MSGLGQQPGYFIVSAAPPTDLQAVAARLRSTPGVASVTERRTPNGTLELLNVVLDPHPSEPQLEAFKQQLQKQFPSLLFEENAELQVNTGKEGD